MKLSIIRAVVPSFPEFVPLSIELADEYRRMVAPFPLYADFNLTNRLCWDLNGTAAVSTLNGNVVLRLPNYVQGGTRTTLVGANELARTVETLLAHAYSSGSKPQLELVPEHVIDQLPVRPSWHVQEDLNNSDHVLSTLRLVKMLGPALRHLRRGVHTFSRHYEQVTAFHKIDITCPLTQESMLRIFIKRESEKQWNDPKYELMALNRLFAYAENFDLLCYGISIRGALAAFIICEPMSATWTIGHFWKADTLYAGIYSYLIYRMSKRLLAQGFEYVNTQQDLGISGLRAFKQSLSPVMHLRKYTLSQSLTSPYVALLPETTRR